MVRPIAVAMPNWPPGAPSAAAPQPREQGHSITPKNTEFEVAKNVENIVTIQRLTPVFGVSTTRN